MNQNLFRQASLERQVEAEPRRRAFPGRPWERAHLPRVRDSFPAPAGMVEQSVGPEKKRRSPFLEP